MGRSSGNLASPMAFSSASHMSDYDICRMARLEFNKVKDEYVSMSRTPGLGWRERRALAHDFVRDCSRTVAAEEAVLLPLLQRYKGDLPAELLERAGQRRLQIKTALLAIDLAPAADPAFDAKMSAAWTYVCAAFADGDRLLCILDRHCPVEERRRAGRAFYTYRLLLAPTRPHPRLPAAGAAGSPIRRVSVLGSAACAALGAAVAPFDWCRDLVRFGFAMPV
jgi:hypothetical protein